MEQFENHIKPFCHITKIPVTYYDTKGNVQWECSGDERSGGFHFSYLEDNDGCRRTLSSAIKIAEQLGEPYIFLCSSGFIKIALSLIIGGRRKGTVIAGPIAMGNNKESVIRNLVRNASFSREIFPELTTYLFNLKVYTPKDVSYLASLFNSTVLSSIQKNEDYEKINQSFKEQADIGERIKKYKEENIQIDYPHELEDKLMLNIKSGDGKSALKTLSSLLDEISIIESGNLPFIKIRVLGICAMFSRVFAKQDATYEISSRELEDMDMINKADSFQELSQVTSKIVSYFAESMSANIYWGKSEITYKAAKYIRDNFMNKITLMTVAEELHTNHSYISTLFNKEMGVGFSDYLNEVRLKRSQDLLSSTGLSMVEIAVRSGFESQSYFTKNFKKKYGMTPSQYRRENGKL